VIAKGAKGSSGIPFVLLFRKKRRGEQLPWISCHEEKEDLLRESRESLRCHREREKEKEKEGRGSPSRENTGTLFAGDCAIQKKKKVALIFYRACRCGQGGRGGEGVAEKLGWAGEALMALEESRRKEGRKKARS